jgi:hypothetical protein
LDQGSRTSLGEDGLGVDYCRSSAVSLHLPNPVKVFYDDERSGGGPATNRNPISGAVLNDSLGRQEISNVSHSHDALRRPKGEIHELCQTVRVTSVELIEGLAAGRGQIGMLIQLVEKRQDVHYSLAGEHSHIPGAQVFGGGDPWGAGAAAQHFGGLAGAAEVRGVNGLDRIICEAIRGLRRFFQPLVVQRDIEPTPQSFISPGQVEAGMSMAYKDELSHSVETPDSKWSSMQREGAIELAFH